MFIKIQKFLGKVLLSTTAFLWAGCDNGSTDAKEKPFIDIEQEMAKLTSTDTTGLKGKCIPEHEYCEMTIWNSYYSAQAHAKSIAIEKINEQHKDEPNYWYKSNSCYRDILETLGNAPVYGVEECPTNLTPCEIEPGNSFYNGVRIDDAYIAELQRKEKNYYETLKNTLEEINQGMEKCN